MPLAPSGGPLLVAIEIDAASPVVGNFELALGWGTRARGTVELTGSQLSATTTLRASDSGYVTRPTDPGGVRAYPARLAEAPAIDRRVLVAPWETGTGVAWGRAVLRNADGALSGVAAGFNSDSRDVRLYVGRRVWGAARGIWREPAFAQLSLLLRCLAAPWLAQEDALVVPLRDLGYWLERPIQSVLYAGSGGLEGGEDLAGKPKPRARGGNAANPLRRVPAVLVDPGNLIFQYTDGPGAVVALYEGGHTGGIAYAGDTTNLYSGSTPPGQYRTDNSKGLFQLGSNPAHPITVDVTGAFPQAGAIAALGDVMRYTLLEDLQMPTDLVDASSFAALPTMIGGYWTGTEPVQAVAVLDFCLQSIGAKLVHTRDGKLRPWLLRAPDPAAPPDLVLTSAAVMDVAVLDLPEGLDPPPYRLRLAYQRNWAGPTTADLHGSITAAERGYISEPARIAGWSSATVLSSYRRPSDPQVFGGAVTRKADAETIVAGLGALWGVRRRLLAVTVPLALAVNADVGQRVWIEYPLDDLRQGRAGAIVGERLRVLEDDVAVLEILV
ncbi:hypothetical protein GCM10010964_43670 [Caldovatus sediminis]|uniref:Uncharacterized protein n=1 Tax=Caldovatus sediminis TaxID=2041189 RepID=A0A8J3EEG4_9PROT|nr:hypothetical protein [Caldovatus sediminis]GGG51761.1 hypothetical protein GCM10010964_43670 [Caldovatus sediminis]